MAVYIVTGKLGSGKSLVCVSKIQDALHEGCRIATNMDLRLEHLVGPNKPRDITRLPDWPRHRDLQALGYGYEGKKFNEKKFGWIILDEMATFLNAREWNGSAGENAKEKKSEEQKERMRLLNWLRHARKFRWHLLLISQDLTSLDKQDREGLAEHVVECKRMDRFGVPIIGGLCGLLGFPRPRMPQVHIGVVRYGMQLHAPVVDKWWTFNGRRLHGAYDTAQRILGENDGPATMLDHRHAPYMWKPGGMRERLWEAFAWRWFPASQARLRWMDFRESQEERPARYVARPTYQEWLSAATCGPTLPDGCIVEADDVTEWRAAA